MDSYQHTHYPEDGVTHRPEEEPLGAPHDAAFSQHDPVPTASDHTPSHEHLHEARLTNTFGSTDPIDPSTQQSKRLSKKWQRRLYWMVPLAILVIVLVVLFEVYKSDFERWLSPLANWLRARKSWSWVLPVVILFVLSFPPLFGHEIVQLIVGLTYPIGVAIGIACAGAILGEAGCFVVFKYGFTWWVEKKIATKVKWAATARVAQQAGFRGVLVIRYSIVPPHLANPLFSCTGMKFWLYMITVILSLPKSIIFVILGTPSSENSKGAKYAKVIAIGVVIAITVFASIWIRKQMAIAIKEIEAERAVSQGDEEQLGMLRPHKHATGTGDTSYQGVATTAPYAHQDAVGSPPYEHT